MEHLLRAEYTAEPDAGGESGEGRKAAGTGTADRTVASWHMVRGHSTQAMCGRVLAEDSEIRSDDDWGRTAEPMCHTCGALYLREVP